MPKALNSLPVQSKIKMYHNGTLRSFIVVHQGKPDEIYDDSCIGTWLLMEDVYENRSRHSTNMNDYENCDLHAYLNNEFYSKFDEGTQAAIKQVKIPYRPGDGTGKDIKDGANGLPCKVFLLSGYELGWKVTDNGMYTVADGVKLDFFTAGTTTKANAVRIAYLNGSAARWWLRSPWTGSSGSLSVNDLGMFLGSNSITPFGVRPALVLPSTMYIDDNDILITNKAPERPSSITIPETVRINKPINITWSPSADPDGDPVSYELERSINAASFTAAYSGTLPAHTETVGTDWYTAQYRVRAKDSQGAYSDYITGPIRNVIHNVDPIISGTDTDIGAVTAPPAFTYQVDDADADDILTVTEMVDSAVIRTIPNAQRSSPYNCSLTTGQFVSLVTGQHRMTIIVADTMGNSAARNITFSREVSSIHFETHAQAADAMPEKVLISLRCSANPDAVSIKVCNNYLDNSPAWEPAADRQKHLFTNTNKTAGQWMVGVQVTIQSTAQEKITCFSLSGAYM